MRFLLRPEQFRLPARLRQVPLVLLIVILLAIAGWRAVELIGNPVAPATVMPRLPALAGGTAPEEVLARCERRLVEARRRMASDRGDGAACLEVAAREMQRANLLALLAYGRRPHARTEPSAQEHEQFLSWRKQFLREDPTGSLALAEAAADAAVRGRLDTRSRRQSLMLIAEARELCGDYHGEAAALSEAARREPEVPVLWLRLSEACGRAHRFAEAERAHERWLALAQPPGASSP